MKAEGWDSQEPGARVVRPHGLPANNDCNAVLMVLDTPSGNWNLLVAAENTPTPVTKNMRFTTPYVY